MANWKKSRVFLFAAVCAGLPLVAAATSRAEFKPPAPKLVQVSGVVTAWRVDEAGRITFRLDDKSSEAPRTHWFTTPASTTVTTRLEHLVLRILLDAKSQGDRRPQRTLTASGERRGDATGRSQSRPLVLETLGWDAAGITSR
jgi:hypothetical protein